MVGFEGLDVQDAGVAARPVQVAVAEGGEEFGEVDQWVLCVGLGASVAIV